MGRGHRSEEDTVIVRRLTGIIILAVGTLSGGTLPAHGQDRATTADLSGVVLDQSSAVVAGATVTATNAATGRERSVVSQRDGRYAIPALPPGTYTIKAAMAGFATGVVENVLLALGQGAEENFTLAVGGTSESITVSATPTPVDAHRTAVATVISQEQIDNLPTNGRDFLSFSVLTPGVSTDRTPQQGASATSGLTFAGQRARSNNITVDGLDNNDAATGAVRATFSQEAVQEFQVVANSYSAEFGKASGGIVNIVTKSGTNTVAGSLFNYFRDEALNAKEHFEQFNPAGERIDQGKAPYSQYQFGGTVGGPIRRSRAFFFLSAERLRVRANNFVNIDSAYPEPVVFAGQNYGTVVDILRRDGFPVEVGHVPYRVESDQALAKVDATVTSNHHLTFRFNWADLLDENVEPWGGLVARSRGAYLDSRDVMGAALLTSVLSSRTVNELRLQVANHDQKVISLDPTCSGVCDQDNEGGPEVDIAAIEVGRQTFTPQPRNGRLYQVVDTLSYHAGRHDLKAGFDFSHEDLRSQALPMTFGGRYVFQQLGPLTDVQALALGRPSAYVQGYGNPSAVGSFIGVSFFAEDEWRLRDRVMLKLGVRYQNQFFPKMTEAVAGLTYDWPTDNNNVAPRLAVSWTPLGDAETSVHGAYGVFYDNQIGAVWGLPAMISGTADHVRIRVVRYPGSVSAWNAPGRRLAEPATTYPSNVITIDPRLKTPYAHHGSVGLERMLAPGLAVSADFLYVGGFDHVGVIEYNPVTNPATGGRPFDINGVPGTSASVSQYTSWGESWYRGLTLSVWKRFDGRFQFLASYTLSKAEDLTPDYAFSVPQNNGFGRNPDDPEGLPLGFNPYSERGPSLQDQRHRLVVSGLYAMGWGVTVSGIVTVGSGRPFNIVAGSDLNHDGDTSLSDRPWTNPDDPATAIARDTGLLPGTSTVDLRVAKRLALGGRASLDLMVEMFNVLNHTNYTQVDAVFGKGAYPGNPLPTFGQFTKAGSPFQAQLAAKLSF